MNPTESYLAALRDALPRDIGAQYRARILQEIEGNLLDSAAAGQEAGLSEGDAVRQAIERCGSPAIIAAGFQHVAVTRHARRIHQSLWPMLVACFVLIALTVWRYPAVLGSSHAIAIALILSAALLAGYGWFVTVILGVAQQALWRGGRAGLLVGLLGLTTLLLSLLLEMWLWKRSGMSVASTIALSDTLNGWAVGLPILGWVTLTIWEGTRRQTSLLVCMATGAISGLFASLVASISALGLTTALAAQLAAGVWLHDATCASTAALVSCELGDTLGGQAIELLLLPLLGIGLAAASQLVWRGMRYLPNLSRIRSTGLTAAAAADGMLVRPLLVFTFVVLLVSSCALVAQFW